MSDPHELPQPVTQPVPPAEEANYDHLFDPAYEGGSVEEAGVQPAPVAQEPEMTPEREAAIDKSLRERTPQGPLTASDIGRIAAQRGRYPTPDDIEGINKARARGLHLS